MPAGSSPVPVVTANPGVGNATVTEWVRDGIVPSISLHREELLALPTKSDSRPLVARFARPRTTQPTRLAVLSDIHLSTNAKGSWKLYHRTEPRLRSALERIDDVDGLVVTGDLTKDGNQADLERTIRCLETADQPVYAVPGNHDATTAVEERNCHVEQIAERFGPGGFPFHTEIGGVDLLCLDSTRAASGTKATVSTDQLDWLRETLGSVETPLVVSHHNLGGLLTATGGQSWRSSFPLQNAEHVGGVLAEADVPLCLSGHLHLPAVAASGGVRELIAPALCSFPGAALLLEIDETGTTVRLVPLADEAGLVEGWQAARSYSERSRMVAWMTYRQLTALPLVDELAEPGRDGAYVDGIALD
jgi:predicted phosphodiesterase